MWARKRTGHGQLRWQLEHRWLFCITKPRGAKHLTGLLKWIIPWLVRHLKHNVELNRLASSSLRLYSWATALRGEVTELHYQTREWVYLCACVWFIAKSVNECAWVSVRWRARERLRLRLHARARVRCILYETMGAIIYVLSGCMWCQLLDVVGVGESTRHLWISLCWNMFSWIHITVLG